ncbi:MAG: response regulator, partial [Desulfatiglandales bacterium]
FKTLGYETETACSGQEAIRLYQEKWKDIDLVLLDMVMPGMDGGKVFEGLQQINPDIKAILARGHCLEGSCEKVVKSACKGFIQKPFNLSELSNLITDVMSA